MAGGAWESSGSPTYDVASSGLQTRIVRHPACAVALLSIAKATDAMNESDTLSSYTAVEPINDDASLRDLTTCSASSSAYAAARVLMGTPGRKPMCRPAAA